MSKFLNEKKIKRISCNTGTSISVMKLFSNVPARLKFIKSANSEVLKIHNLINYFSLVYPNIDFQLITDGKLKLDTTGSSNILDIYKMIYGIYSKNNLLLIDDENRGRVMGLYTINFGLIPLGAIPLGFIADILGIQQAYFFAGLLLIIFALGYTIFTSKIRKL